MAIWRSYDKELDPKYWPSHSIKETIDELAGYVQVSNIPLFLFHISQDHTESTVTCQKESRQEPYQIFTIADIGDQVLST